MAAMSRHSDRQAERATARGGEHASHEVIEATGPSWPGATAQAGVGRDEHLDAVGDDRLDLALVPVAGVGEDEVWGAELDGTQLALRRADHRLEVPEVR